MAQHTFAALASLLFLSEDNDAWVEQDSPMRKDSIARIFVDHNTLWIEHPATKQRIEVTQYARVIPSRSLAFRPVKSWPRRVALRMKSERTTQRFVAFAKEHGVQIKQSSTSKTEKTQPAQDPRLVNPRESAEYNYDSRHFRDNSRSTGSHSRQESHSSSTHSNRSRNDSPYFTFPSPDDRPRGSRQNSREMYGGSPYGLVRSSSSPELIMARGKGNPMLVVVPKPAGESQRLYRKAGLNTISVELPKGIKFKNVVVLCKVSNLPKVLALLFVGDMEKSCRADVLIFDKNIHKGYRIDADENFGLEPMCPVRRLGSYEHLKTSDAASKIKTQVKLDVIDSLDHVKSRSPDIYDRRGSSSRSASFREVY